MLVLTRKLGQEIQIGEHVTVKVLSVRGGAVRLGIEAPASVRILRQELNMAEMDQDRSGQEYATREQESPQQAWTASLARVIPGRADLPASPSQVPSSLAIMASRRRQGRRALRRVGS